MRSVKVGICQMQVEEDKTANLQKAESMIREERGKAATL